MEGAQVPLTPASAGGVAQKKAEVPATAPNVVFPSLAELKSCLPAEVFVSNPFQSVAYAAFDLAVSGLLLYLAITFRDYPFVYTVYALLQGTMFWAWFVIGHDCGHGSFSDNPLLNDVVGTVMHSGILVPFYPWKLSHRSHHNHTGNIDEDEVFHPVRKSEWEPRDASNKFLKSKAYFLLGMAWFLYLVVGYHARANDTRASHSHLSWEHPLWAKHQTGFFWSIWAWRSVVAALGVATYVYGFSNVFFYYFVPLFVFGTWITLTTFLHHHDHHVDLPWYGAEQWNYVKGNLSSIDRDYGIFHWLTHNIGTHQIHHVFPSIPHYNLIKATAAFRAKFPHLARASDESIFKAFYRTFKVYGEQFVIDDNATYVSYREKSS